MHFENILRNSASTAGELLYFKAFYKVAGKHVILAALLKDHCRKYISLDMIYKFGR